MTQTIEKSERYQILENAENDIYEYKLASEELQPLYVRAGSALAWIKETKSYKRVKPTFEEYCKDRWGYSARHASNLINASNTTNSMAQVIVESGTIVPVLPKTESQVRELKPLETPEEQVEAMTRANEIAKEEDREVTAKDVKQAVEEKTGKPNSKPKVVEAEVVDETPNPSEEPQSSTNMEAAEFLCNQISALIKPDKPGYEDAIGKIYEHLENLVDENEQ